MSGKQKKSGKGHKRIWKTAKHAGNGPGYHTHSMKRDRLSMGQSFNGGTWGCEEKELGMKYEKRT